MSEFFVTVSTPLPEARRVADFSINPMRTTLRWSSALPGGHERLEVGLYERGDLRGGILAIEAAMPVRAHIEVHSGSQLLWSGRRRRAHWGNSGMVSGLFVDGYGMVAGDDNYLSIATYPHLSDPTLVTGGAILRDTLSALTPILVPGNTDQFVDPLSAHTLGEFDGFTPGKIATQLIAEGGAVLPNSVTWDYYVLGQVVYFLPRVQPASIDYLIPFDSTVKWEEDEGAIWSHVAVDYTDATTNTKQRTAEAYNPAVTDFYQIEHHELVPGGTLSAAAAIQLRDTTLAQHAAPIPQVSVSRSQGRGLEGPSGKERPPWLACVGQWLKVADRPALPLIRCEYDGTAGTLQVDLGAPSPTNWYAVQAKQRQSIAQLSGGINPFSGSRQ